MPTNTPSLGIYNFEVEQVIYNMPALKEGLLYGTIIGNELNNQIFGNAAANILVGSAGADTLSGGRGDDDYVIDSADDVLQEKAGQGYDTVHSSVSWTLGANFEALSLTGEANIDGTGNNAANYIYGNRGNNVLDGRGGNDVIFAGGGDDKVLGGNGMDFVFAGEGSDTIEGGKGNDTINGGSGSDMLTGGKGKDAFEFSDALGDVDTITDFSVNHDRIQLDSAVFQALDPDSIFVDSGTGMRYVVVGKNGQLKADSFTIGTEAKDANDFIIYNRETGALSYDADGSGAGAAVQFATLSTKLALAASHFFIV